MIAMLKRVAWIFAVLLEQLLDAEAVHKALKERLEDAGCIR